MEQVLTSTPGMSCELTLTSGAPQLKSDGNQASIPPPTLTYILLDQKAGDYLPIRGSGSLTTWHRCPIARTNPAPKFNRIFHQQKSQ